MRSNVMRDGAVRTLRHPRTTLPSVKDNRYSVQDSRSVRSVWVWRGFLMMSLVAIGVAIILLGNGAPGFAIAWLVIACGWFAISMWLWRQHTHQERQ
jgi:hypothetical protein